jgi:hypothetical protein
LYDKEKYKEIASDAAEQLFGFDFRTDYSTLKKTIEGRSGIKN